MLLLFTGRQKSCQLARIFPAYCCGKGKMRGVTQRGKLRGMPDSYKIKLKSPGYRLVYQVIEEKVVVFVVSVGKRERPEVYSEAVKRIL
ncbi:hypothetical protein C3432_21125 [Citrobacter amalonaticus]|uniref:Uncharacterized protein n=1 Tax=Citrobacter amalonaticus TaxID=35703 RepID=A0A2S4RV03_CITAM|nr:hypothetical protein C3432_21125 [Citrobacter amalonaticus]POT73766.1 hypothetical protein C3436_18590 [Citrobacter amalonaticus]POU63991.1 hypothetical protein C3430_17525 [Citrobacter amalonaticus]POV03624.1 hypothetical protein C3424_20440 [Citrobacter amalonaticus]